MHQAPKLAKWTGKYVVDGETVGVLRPVNGKDTNYFTFEVDNNSLTETDEWVKGRIWTKQSGDLLGHNLMGM